MLNRLALLTASAAILTAAAPASPSAESVLSRVRAATGGDAWSKIDTLRFNGQLAVAGLKGPFTGIEDVRSGRSVETFDLGPFAGRQGFDGATAWSADSAGIVDPQESDGAARRAANGAYRASRAYLKPGFGGAAVEYVRSASEGDKAFDVVAITPKGGARFELWVDRATGLPARMIEKGDTDTTTTFLEDYRTVGGLRLPYVVRSSTGAAANDQVTTIASYALNPKLDAAALARPASQIRDARIAGGGTATVPMLFDGGHVRVNVAVNGSEPLPFIIDSGAGSNLMTPEAAKLLGIEGKGQIAVSGVGNATVPASFAQVKALKIGDAELSGQRFIILDLPPIMDRAVRGEKPLAGLLGYDFLRRFVAKMDYEKGLLTLTSPKACPATRAANQLPLVFAGNRIPEVKASLNGVEGLWALDTGASGESSLFPAFAAANGFDKVSPSVEITGPGGVGGALTKKLARFGEFAIGPYKLAAPYMGLSSQAKGAFSNAVLAGNLGSSLFRNFTVTFDYECRTMTLEPNGNYGKAEPVNRAGISFTVTEDGGPLRVLHVVAGSPAEQAGVRAGDALVEIDGRAAQTLSYGEVRRALQRAEGETVSLAFDRGGARHVAGVVLREPVPAAKALLARR